MGSYQRKQGRHFQDTYARKHEVDIHPDNLERKRVTKALGGVTFSPPTMLERMKAWIVKQFVKLFTKNSTSISYDDANWKWNQFKNKWEIRDAKT